MESSIAAGADDILQAAIGAETGQRLDREQTLYQTTDAERLGDIRGQPIFRRALLLLEYAKRPHHTEP